jgi:hypothetical protein
MKRFSQLFSVSPKRKAKAGNIMMKLKMFLKKTRADENKVKFKGQTIDLNIISDVDGSKYNRNQALKDLKIIERNFSIYEKHLVDTMYNPYAKGWMESNQKMSSREWLDGLELMGINFYSDGVPEIWWADDNIFGGHMLAMELLPKTFKPRGGVQMNG